ncbi:MAG: cytochrome c biogenesis protein CcsA [Thermaceae bacterium]|nr:cytochrome c biogenesis protein CcsA [Thermaceae bacterium]
MQLTRSSEKGDGLTTALLSTGLAVLLVGFYLALNAPPDANQGWLVRILYLHVPMAWLCYLAIFGTLAYSVAYLVRRNPHYDRVAAVSAEIGLLFSALTVLTGALWGRPTWGVYWTWEPRLTTFAILIAVYVGYFIVRSAIEDPELRANASAAIGILGSINVPISYMSVKWWRSLHQTQTIDLTTGKVNMEPSMLLALMVNLLAFTLLYFAFMRLRGQIARYEAQRQEAAHG